MSLEPMDTITLVISGLAFTVSIFVFVINYVRGRKTEQIKLAIDISSRLDESETKMFDIEDRLNASTIDHGLKSTLRRNHRDAYILYLNHLEFFAFLVNNDELKDRKILDYFKPNFVSGVKGAFEKYNNIRDDKEKAEEIKKLLKEWDPKYYSLHFESK